MLSFQKKVDYSYFMYLLAIWMLDCQNKFYIMSHIEETDPVLQELISVTWSSSRLHLQCTILYKNTKTKGTEVYTAFLNSVAYADCKFSDL
jgi:hypothetical protein